MKFTKTAISIVVIGVLIVSGFLGYQKFTKTSKEIKKTAVKTGTLKIDFSIDGKTVIDRRDLKFTVSGKVAKINVKEGQEVKRGQYLMALDTQDVQKNIQKDLKDYQITRNNFDQTTQVTYPSGAVNDTVKRILDNNQSTLDKSVLDVEIRDIALKESYLYAPIDGIVSAINIREGETTNTQNSTSVITITKPGSLTFEAYAEDTDVLKINKEQKTVVKIDALPGTTYSATVDFISNLATVDANGLSSYKVRALLTDPKATSLLDGMTGQIQFITKEKTGILIIPNGAVTRKDNKSFVTKLYQGKPQETVVETGFTDGKEVEVVSGLALGDEIILP